MLTSQSHPFKLVTEASVLPNLKNRVSITKVLSKDNTLYDIFVNDLGQILLNPIATIPDYELWLFKDKKARAVIEKGLKNSAEGKVHEYVGSFSKKRKTIKRKQV